MSDSALDRAEIGKIPTKASATGIPVVEPPSPEEAKVELVGPAHDCEGVDGLPPEYSFDLDYTDQRGYHWHGRFRSKVLSVAERTMVGLTRARMCMGIPLASIDDATLQIFEMMAHLGVALKDVPEWAEDLSNLYDRGVVGAIYLEVASYEARFWGTEAPKAG